MAAKRKQNETPEPVADDVLSVYDGAVSDGNLIDGALFDFLEAPAPETPFVASGRVEGGQAILTLHGVGRGQIKSASGELVQTLHGLEVIGVGKAAEALVFDAEAFLWRVVFLPEGPTELVFLKV